jgi:hypothetical protein
MKIDTPELKKAAGVACTHCTSNGCGIYETRYPVCRSFYCAWRWTPELSDEWRPDRSGVLVVRLNEGIPERFPTSRGYYFIMLGGEAAIGRLGFVDVVLALVARSVPAFMAATSPMGDVYGHAIMNPKLAAAAIKRDRAAAFETLVSLHQQLMAGRSADTFRVSSPVWQPEK